MSIDICTRFVLAAFFNLSKSWGAFEDKRNVPRSYYKAKFKRKVYSPSQVLQSQCSFGGLIPNQELAEVCLCRIFVNKVYCFSFLQHLSAPLFNLNFGFQFAEITHYGEQRHTFKLRTISTDFKKRKSSKVRMRDARQRHKLSSLNQLR